MTFFQKKPEETVLEEGAPVSSESESDEFHKSATSTCEENPNTSEAMVVDDLVEIESDRNPAKLHREGCASEARPEFDLDRNFPTDRGHFVEDIENTSFKRNIIQHGPCRPDHAGSFEIVDERGNASSNFSARYYNKYIEEIKVPRLWLCYSLELKKPFCEVCWLLADRTAHNHNIQRGWVNGVQGSGHNIKHHEKSNMHIEASAVYMKWKSGKVLDEEDEKEIRRNSSFWVKVLHRLILIVLTLATLNLAFCGHHEHVSDNICEGGNFLGLVALMAKYDETLAEVISLPTRATKYLSAKIQNELV